MTAAQTMMKAMERRPFGPTRREVPVIGQGTWFIDQGSRGTAVAALRRGLDLGLTHIDTAEMYGAAEDIVGDAIAGRRDEVLLVLQEIAAAHGATSRQVALRFLVRRAAVFAIPKAATPEHVAENAGAGMLPLSTAELARIEAAFPLGPRPRTLPVL